MRDPSAHYHLIFQADTTNATASDRFKIYVNGVRVTAFDTATYPAQNYEIAYINNTQDHRIGAFQDNTPSNFDGYLSDVHFIDGQALTPAAFGQFDSNGMWQPKPYTGTYGANGFRLRFDDATSTTTLMADSSGNGNNWTANNISLTTGPTYDSMLDVPLGSGGAERGNHPVLNRLSHALAANVIGEGNLSLVNYAGTYYTSAGSTFYVSSGKWYFEASMTGSGASNTVGVHKGTSYTGSTVSTSGAYQTQAGSVGYTSDTGVISLGGVTQSTGATWTAGDAIGVALDMTAGTVQFYKNNVAQGSPVTGISGDYTPAFALNYFATSTLYPNFGQRPFAYTPPVGFKPLHTGNLSAGAVAASGSFSGNAAADGPFVWCNGTPETLAINGNAVTWGTHADRLANGFKLRTASTSYNASGTNTWTATVLSPQSKSAFNIQTAKANP
ncbi:SPRY domain-containing protein [Rhodoferax aquaticus]|uniref:SPRY domain-containing protein n=1 Tax=Rhodoferax aquaticus TaxID=2527691 RepID=UPI00143D0CC5|nr:SPRY domain-containing protein [Rhodoferax aquaticus]